MRMERYLLETYGTAEQILNDNRRIMDNLEREFAENPIAELPEYKEEVVEIADASFVFGNEVTEDTEEEV